MIKRMIKFYFAKSKEKTPGGLSELGWRLCADALCREISGRETSVCTADMYESIADPGRRDRFICYGSKGKPYLKEGVAGRKQLFFNLSHSGEYAVCTIADEEIGCDIQVIGAVRERLIERYLHRKEAMYIGTEGEPEDSRSRRFTRIWTMRESYTKMTGEGLTVMEDFYVDCSGEINRVLRRTNHQTDAYEPVRAAFEEVAVDPDYSCLVCAENSAIFGLSIPCFNMTGMIEYN